MEDINFLLKLSITRSGFIMDAIFYLLINASE